RVAADEDVSQSVGQTSINQRGAQSYSRASLETENWELHRYDSASSVSSEFQDSNLSPALPLLPANSGVAHIFNEYSLFQQSDNEFAPLRAYPDISMASERFQLPPQDRTTQASERGSLSQHPLAQTTVLSEEGTTSCCSLSQHSLSPVDEGRRGEAVHSPVISTTDTEGVQSRDDTGSREDSETPTDPPDKQRKEAVQDEAFFLSKDVPAQHLLELLQKDIGMPSSSSSAVSSVKMTAKESKSAQVCEAGVNQSTVRREGPPGEASLPQRQTQQPDRDLQPDQSQTSLSDVCNITSGPRSTKPDDSSEELRRELLSEVERRSSREAESKNQQRKSPALPAQSLTANPTETSKGKPSVTRTNLRGVPWTGPFSTGLERGHREQDFWSSGNQTGIDGSYLGILPQSQSTPGVFKAPPKSSVKVNLWQLSAIESNKESSYQSNTGISPQPAAPVADVHQPDTPNQCQDEATSAKVQSLPSLNYMQKVDAWRANQSSGQTSLFDSLALQGFSGISPKKKAYDAVSDSLNRILSQQARCLQQPLVSSAASQNVTQSSSTDPSASSSSRRGEAAGSAPSDKDNTASAARPSTSSFGRSQSHSSLSTVIMSAQKNQQTEQKEKSQTQDDAHHQPRTTAQPPPPFGLSKFSDLSLDQDLTLSSSQDSCNSGIKLGTSVRASSVVSLEVDNYAPYWTSKLSTPPPLPRPRELNIEERIPLYLHNLGIDQSPSTILTPFAPRGPIREPEFSPTDLCTVKGSVGTPTKSTQPSEGDSPHKGEFSQCSVVSVDSSISIPFSLDSLGPALSVPERTRRPSPLLDSETTQSERRLAPHVQTDENRHSSTLQTTQQQQRDSSLTSSRNTIQLENRFDSDPSLATKAPRGDRDSESSLKMSRGTDQSAKAFLDIRKLLAQADRVVSAGSSVASSASPAAPRLLSDVDIFLSPRKKASKLQDSSSSSTSAPGHPRTGSSLLCVRSSSDSMLTSDKLRESSIGRESMTSSGKPHYPSTQALITSLSTGASTKPQESTVNRGAGSSFVLSQPARRAEPEGCSAAPPDNTVPPQPPVVKPSPALIVQPLTSVPADTVGVTEEETQTTPESPAQSGSSSSVLEDTDQGVVSDGSSESSLAVRVAKLLQSESPATMVSSTPSITDQEESKAREWIKLKISGQQCEPLELDQEDRKRIEEIKRELLLKNPIKSQGSTDTGSSAASSVRVPKSHYLPQQVETFTALTDANNQPSQPPQHLNTNLSDSSVQLQNPPSPDLEAQIREIAAREGVTIPRTKPLALTSITIATRRRSASPSPSTSPAPSFSPAAEPLHLNELAVEHPNRQLPPDLNEEEEMTMETSQSAESANQKRQDAVGGQFEEPPTPSQGLGREDTNAKDNSLQSFRRDDELLIQDSSVSGVGHEAEQATGSSTSESPSRSGHISQVRLTLSPKPTDHSSAAAVHSDRAGAVSRQPRKEFIPLTHSSSASSPDEAVPVLLPYKPHGSEELFYVPQKEADVSSPNPSDTTMESTHTGSDDAVPPRFSSDVLGHRDPGLDRGVTIRHTEGIYSKRLKTATFKMQESGHRGASPLSADGPSSIKCDSSCLKPSSQVPLLFQQMDPQSIK
ncbi:hypothetical protein L3Q82_026277, partial [Scortum barcoo]